MNFILLLAPTILPVVSAACYYPNGKLAPNDVPCRDDISNSVCCGQGYACLSNGICQATGDELQKEHATEYVRGSCTDRNWRSSACPLFCIDPDVDNVGGGEGIGKCSKTTEDMYWCVNLNQNAVDCDRKQNVLFFPGKPTVITTIGVSPTNSAQPLSTSSPPTTTAYTTAQEHEVLSSTRSDITPTLADVKNDSKSTSPNTNASIIGGAIGAAMGVLLLGGSGFGSSSN
ncbi:hypothetical protein BGZ63DRAFT_401211 [Mariannaea sp. PMI_226]|nr:hypothetical protein BGZ63DRAFT_401211 [Mariannaea sp. PMI_226]